MQGQGNWNGAGLRRRVALKGVGSLSRERFSILFFLFFRDTFLTTQDGTGGDQVYVPDQNGVKYLVFLVKRKNGGIANDRKLCILRRQVVNWPSNNV